MIYGAQYIQLLTLGVPVQSSLPSAVTNCTKSFDIITRSTICFHTKAQLLQNNFNLEYNFLCQLLKLGTWSKHFYIQEHFLDVCNNKLLISAISKSVTNK